MEDFTLKHLLHFKTCASQICENFVYKHSETKEYFLRNLQTARSNNSRIPRIKNAKFSWYCFSMNTKIYGICISVPLTLMKNSPHLIISSYGYGIEKIHKIRNKDSSKHHDWVFRKISLRLKVVNLLVVTRH